MKPRTKTLFAKTGLFAAAALALALAACQSLKDAFKEPRLSLHSVNLTGISFTQADLLCKVNVENPNPIDIPFPEIAWELFINSNSLVRGLVKNDQFIKSRATTVVNIPLSMTYADIFNTVKSLKDSKEADYLVALGIKFALPILGNKTWNLEHEGKLPVLRVPSISFKGISVKNISLTRLDFEIDWEVENKNSFTMNVKELLCDFTVNSSQWVSGKVPGAPPIPPDQKTLIPLAFSINSAAMVKDITAIITKGTSITYACQGSMNLGGSAGISDLKLPFNFTGTTRLRN
jgi:LEA14-like dessication related protein